MIHGNLALDLAIICRASAYVARVGVEVNLVRLGVEGAGVERAVDRSRVGASVVDAKPN